MSNKLVFTKKKYNAFISFVLYPKYELLLNFDTSWHCGYMSDILIIITLLLLDNHSIPYYTRNKKEADEAKEISS